MLYLMHMLFIVIFCFNSIIIIIYCFVDIGTYVCDEPPQYEDEVMEEEEDQPPIV
jgi:hypothetical protein